MKELNELNAKWLAGITDCEVGIFIQKHKRKADYGRRQNEGITFELYWAINQTRKELMLEIKNVLELKNKLSTHKKKDELYQNQFISYKTQFGLRISKQKDLEYLLIKILPFVTIKKEQVKLGLEFLNYKQALKKGHQPTDKEKLKLEIFYNEMKKLNS